MRPFCHPAALVQFLCFATLTASASSGLPAPQPDSDLVQKRWPAHWITDPAAPRSDYAVLLLRRTFSLDAKPARFVVHVTGDARYRLKVNGHSVATGPQWSSSPSWRYESVDLAPWLQAGRNVLTARVHSYGDHGPLASQGRRIPGFLLQGDTPAERIVDTGTSWKVKLDDSSRPFADDRGRLHTYFALGPGESRDAARHPWGWEDAAFDDAGWNTPKRYGLGIPAGQGAEDALWLYPRTTPLMEETPERLATVTRATGVTVDPAFPAGRAPFTVPAHAEATVVLDQGHLTNAYPQLTVSGGRGARVLLAYGEAMVDAKMQKAHRDESEGREVVGIGDEFLPDGGAQRLFTSDDFRTYRFVQLRIKTAAEPLTVDDFSGVFTGYPFAARGRFASDDPRLAKIWEVGWRTARLCAVETYFDCPYYEQLQYIGDTRIQALISYYVAGDDRLARHAIELFDRSRLPEGITQSRYPSASAQLIPTFSLFWIDMVHDYWRLRDDRAFVGARLPGVRTVTDWFERHLDRQTGLLGALPYWPFVDWVPGKEWPADPKLDLGGVPPGGREGGSAVITLQFASTLRHAADLYRAFGREADAAACEALSARLNRTVVERCWDEERRLLADTPAKKTFSQHANTFAVLSGAISGDRARDLMQRVAADSTLAQATTYFQFYVFEAMKRAGLGDAYIAGLAPWHRMLDRGLTTFAEKEDPTRSDCHAWSASPLYGLLATVCGIEPASPGFATVRIAPHLGPLQRAEGKAMHPKGEIVARLQRAGTSGLSAEIALPDGVTGELVWEGKTVALRAGKQSLTLP